MLSVTDTAAEILTDALASREVESSQMIRIAFSEGEYALTLDDARDDDAVIQHAGQGLLLMDPDVSEALSEFVLDAQDTPAGPRLTLTRS